MQVRGSHHTDSVLERGAQAKRSAVHEAMKAQKKISTGSLFRRFPGLVSAAVALVILAGIPLNAHADEGASARTKEIFKVPGQGSNPVAVSLEDVRDTGILLRFIRMNVFGIYQEASREEIRPDSNVDLAEVITIPFRTTGKLLPARLQWLVFFLGTIEPIITELKKEVGTGDDALNPVIPDEVKSIILPLWKDWSNAILKINSHLDELAALFDDVANNNAKIQAVAVAMNEDVNRLEEVRKRIFKAMQQIQKNSPNSKILVSPPSP